MIRFGLHLGNVHTVGVYSWGYISANDVNAKQVCIITSINILIELITTVAAIMYNGCSKNHYRGHGYGYQNYYT